MRMPRKGQSSSVISLHNKIPSVPRAFTLTLTDKMLRVGSLLVTLLLLIPKPSYADHRSEYNNYTTKEVASLATFFAEGLHLLLRCGNSAGTAPAPLISSL